MVPTKIVYVFTEPWCIRAILACAEAELAGPNELLGY